MTRIKIATGMVTWCGTERRTDRYGAIAFTNSQYGASGTVGGWALDREIIDANEGTEGVLLAVVTETRDSNHVGDGPRKIKPRTPNVGDEIPLGKGKLFRQINIDWPNAGSDFVGVNPGGGRARDWMNPHALYRVHEQTIDLYFIPGGEMEPYDEPPALHEVANNGDGSFQIKSATDNVLIAPRIEKLGDGLFAFGPHYDLEKIP